MDRGDPVFADAMAAGIVPAVFFLSAATLANEIVLIRLLSFRFWPHFVPLIVSQAMLGFGGAGVALQIVRRRDGDPVCVPRA